MTNSQAHQALIAGGGMMVRRGDRHLVTHLGCCYVCGVDVYKMRTSGTLVNVFVTPVSNGWTLGPDSLLEQNLRSNAEAVARALADEEVARILEVCV